VKLRVLDIARAARAKGPPSQEKLKLAYGKLLNSTSRVVGQAKRFPKEIAEGVKRSTKRVCIPNRNTKSSERKREQKS
jgi:transposase, IS5 family